MGWTRRANPRWANWRSRKQADYSINYDQHGNTKRDGWCTTWTTGSTRSFKRITNRQYRIAGKLQIAYELYEDEQWQEELREQELDQFFEDEWYDDDPMDLPDWWYEPQPEEPIDPYDDPHWFDGYFNDPYEEAYY